MPRKLRDRRVPARKKADLRYRVTVLEKLANTAMRNHEEWRDRIGRLEDRMGTLEHSHERLMDTYAALLMALESVMRAVHVPVEEMRRVMGKLRQPFGIFGPEDTQQLPGVVESVGKGSAVRGPEAVEPEVTGQERV